MKRMEKNKHLWEAFELSVICILNGWIYHETSVWVFLIVQIYSILAAFWLVAKYLTEPNK